MTEFYNERLLPKGMPEIIAQFVPYEHAPLTKVITFPRKLHHGLRGQFLCRHGPDGPKIMLWPTVISFHAHAPVGNLQL